MEPFNFVGQKSAQGQCVQVFWILSGSIQTKTNRSPQPADWNFRWNHPTWATLSSWAENLRC